MATSRPPGRSASRSRRRCSRGRIRLSSEAAPVSPPVGSRPALDPLHHLDHLGPRRMAGGEARAPARVGEAPADRAGGVVELNGAVTAFWWLVP